MPSTKRSAPPEPRLETDEQAVRELRDKFLTIVKEHYLAHHMSQARVFEVLNALGIVAATVIGGTQPNHEDTWNYLDLAISMHLPECIEASKKIHVHDGGTSAH